MAPPAHELHYQFERHITFQHGDGSTSAGRVDCYKRGHFVWESKKLKAGVQAQHSGNTTKAFDDALLKARTQSENYARALPAIEGRPPFVVVVDVGLVTEPYAEFTRSGATYTPYPDPRSHRIRLAQLADPAIRARLKALWRQTDIDGVETKAEAEARADEAEAVDTEAGNEAKPQAVAAATTTQPWPPTLPEQVRAVAQLLSASPAPLPLLAIEAAFKGKGPWKKGLPRILDTLEALGRARQEGGGWRG